MKLAKIAESNGLTWLGGPDSLTFGEYAGPSWFYHLRHVIDLMPEPEAWASHSGRLQMCLTEAGNILRELAFKGLEPVPVPSCMGRGRMIDLGKDWGAPTDSGERSLVTEFGAIPAEVPF